MIGKIRLTLILLIIILPASLLAQAPAISYTSPQTLSMGSPVTLSPQNTGGAVPQTFAYSQVSTFAGSGAAGSTNATGTAASFNFPTGVAVDGNKNVYVADATNHIIRKIDQAGNVSTFAGNGVAASINGTGTGASFGDLYYLTFDPTANALYACDGNAIRKITLTGTVTTIAGNYSSSGLINANNGTAARFYSPAGLCTDATGNIYVADKSNNLIRKITPGGSVTTYAGDGAFGTIGHEHDNGPATSASFTSPNDIAADANGNLFVTESGYDIIRKISTTGFVSNYAGTGAGGNTDGPATTATFDYPEGICTDKIGNVYITQDITSAIRKISTDGQVTTIAGSAVTGSTNGIGTAATFNRPTGMAADNGQFYVADALNNKIRLISLTGYIINKPLPPGLSFDGKTGVISGSPTASTAADDYIITAYNTAGSSSTTLRLVINNSTKITPVIHFTIPAGTHADANGNITPNGYSDNTETPIYYTSDNPSVAIITPDGLIHLVGLGVATITAHQDASANYNAADDLHASIDYRSVQTLTFPPISPKTVCDADFSANVTSSSSSGIPITYTSNNLSVASISSGGIIHIVGPGSVIFTANQAADTHYDAAPAQTQVLTVIPPVNPTISISAASYTPCDGATITFTASITNGGSNPVYQWFINGAPVANNNTNTFTSSILHNNDMISCTVTNTTDCSTLPNGTAASNSITVTLNSYVIPQISIASTVSGPVCSGSSITFTAISNINPTNASYQWRVNGINSGANSPTFTTISLNNGDVVTCQLMAGVNACAIPAAISSTNSITVSIITNEIPSVTVGASATTIYADTPVIFTATVTNITATPFYQWQINGVNSGSNSPVFTTNRLRNNDIITCTITSVTGCVAPQTSIPITITVLPPPKVNINNTFTPNGDGINDVWNIPDLSFYPDCLVSIFDRSGSLLYQSKSYSNPWDGTFNGRPLSVGTYYYVVKLSAVGSSLSGSITIIR